MYCQKCGAPEVESVCPRCGSLAPESIAERAAASRPLTVSSVAPPSGVMGWLLFLCLSLTILGPLVQGRIAWTALTNLATTPVTSNGTVLRLSTVGAIYAGLTAFSICAGLLLWLEEPRAVSVAKAYLLIAPTLVIPLYAILTLAGLKVNLVRVVFGRLVYSIVWYTYLSTSKRVRETYFRSTA